MAHLILRKSFKTGRERGGLWTRITATLLDMASRIADSVFLFMVCFFPSPLSTYPFAGFLCSWICLWYLFWFELQGPHQKSIQSPKHPAHYSPGVSFLFFICLRYCHSDEFLNSLGFFYFCFIFFSPSSFWSCVYLLSANAVHTMKILVLVARRWMKVSFCGFYYTSNL